MRPKRRATVRLATCLVVLACIVAGSVYGWLVEGPVADGSDKRVPRFAPVQDSLATESKQPGGRAILLLFTSVTWNQFHEAVVGGELPALAAHLAEGALGLMNTNTALYRRADDAYVTVGAGTRARDASGAVREAANAAAVAGVYQRRMGLPTGGARVLHYGVAALCRANSDLDHAVTPGAMGEALRQAGVPAAVIGNADIPGQPNRGAVAVAMDAGGRVPFGAVDEGVVVVDETAASGMRTDWERVWAEYTGLPFERGLVVVETGDFVRLDLVANELSPEQVRRHRELAFRGVNAFIDDLLASLDPTRDLFMAASIAPDSPGGTAQDALTPLFALGAGVTPGGLTSDTTRREGLIANVDIAPSVLKYFAVPRPATMTGVPLQSRPIPPGATTVRATGGLTRLGSLDANPGSGSSVTESLATTQLAWLDAKHDYALFNHSRRWPYLLRPYIWAYLGALVLAVWSIFRTGAYTPVASLTLGIMVIPLVLLVLPLVPLPGGLATAIFTLATTLVLTGVLMLLRRIEPLLPLAALGTLTSTMIVADILAGGQLAMTSPLGYSAIVGARYYGIGNEYMGILLGATLVGLCAIADVASGPGELRELAVEGLLVASMAGVFYVVASPALGANLGGTIAAAAGFAMAVLRLRRGPVGLRELATAGVVAVLAVGLLGAWDLSRPLAEQTHIGHAFQDILTTRGEALIEIALRKAEMNIRLFRWTLWSRVLVASVLVFVALVYRPAGIFSRVAERFPYVAAGLHGIATLTVVAFVVNDSGVVFGALSMLFGASTIIYLVVTELTDRSPVA